MTSFLRASTTTTTATSTSTSTKLRAFPSHSDGNARKNRRVAH
jgi:hypothetical protein